MPQGPGHIKPGAQMTGGALTPPQTVFIIAAPLAPLGTPPWNQRQDSAMKADPRANRPHRTEQAKRRMEDRNKRLSSTLRDNLNKRKRQAQAQAQAQTRTKTPGRTD